MMEVETETRAKKRSYDSAFFNSQTQTPQQINNSQMMIDCSNSLALIVVPPAKQPKLGAKPKKQRRRRGTNSQGGLVIPPKSNQMMMDCSNSLALTVVPPVKPGAKPKKQRRSRKGTNSQGGLVIPPKSNHMMMDCSNSLALTVVPPAKPGAKPKKQRSRKGTNSQGGLAIPPKKHIAKPKPKPKPKTKKQSSAKPKKQQGRRGGLKIPKQTFDEAGCGCSADKTMLSKLLDCLEKDMKYKDITDVKIISERQLTATDLKVRQCRLAFSRQRIRTPFLANLCW